METSLVSSASLDQVPVSLRSSASSIPTSFGSPATFRITLPPSVTRSPCASPSLRRSSSQVKIIASSPNLSVTIETPLEQTQETVSLSSSTSSSSSQLTIITVQSNTTNGEEDNDEHEHSPSSPLLSSSSSTLISEAELERRRLEAALEYETQEQADTAVISSIKFFAVGFLVLFLVGAILTFIHTGLIFQLDDYCAQELHRLTYPWGADTATDSKYTYKVAFVGNTGEKPKDVWKLIEKEGADALVHMGDYASEVESLRQQLLENFSGKLPVILNLGDQNAGLFKQTAMKETVELAFQRILSSKYETHYSCDGEVGLRTVCSMHNAVIISLATNLGCCDAKMDYELWLGKWNPLLFSSLPPASFSNPVTLPSPQKRHSFDSVTLRVSSSALGIPHLLKKWNLERKTTWLVLSSIFAENMVLL
jgi:hypothetical protein